MYPGATLSFAARRSAKADYSDRNDRAALGSRVRCHPARLIHQVHVEVAKL